MSTQTRIITIVATKGGRIEKIETDAVTWLDLKHLIQDKYDLSNLKAVENVGKTTLEHPDAILPTGDFRLFLRPSKTKSGADFSSMSFGDMKDFVKNNDDAKAYLNSVAAKSGRNWTQLKTEERREALTKWSASQSATQPASAEVVEEVSSTNNPLSASQKITQAKILISEAVDEFDNEDIYEIADEVQEELNEILSIAGAKMETEEERLEREDIEREMREMEEGF